MINLINIRNQNKEFANLETLLIEAQRVSQYERNHLIRVELTYKEMKLLRNCLEAIAKVIWIMGDEDEKG